jgi:hypothetical protein
MGLIAKYLDDRDLEKVLFTQLGCYYQPSGDGLSARVWLQRLAAQLIATPVGEGEARRGAVR